MKTAMHTSLYNTATQIAEPARQAWTQLSPSGQRAVAVASLLLGIGLLWAFVYQPLQQSRAKDTQRIAQLRADLAQMQALAAERQSLLGLPNLPVTGAAGSATSARPADVGALQAELGPTFKVLLVPSDTAGGKTNPQRTQFRVVVADVPYTELIDRVAAASQRYRLTTRDMALTRKAGTGQSVTGTITLAEAP